MLTPLLVANIGLIAAGQEPLPSDGSPTATRDWLDVIADETVAAVLRLAEWNAGWTITRLPALAEPDEDGAVLYELPDEWIRTWRVTPAGLDQDLPWHERGRRFALTQAAAPQAVLLHHVRWPQAHAWTPSLRQACGLALAIALAEKLNISEARQERLSRRYQAALSSAFVTEARQGAARTVEPTAFLRARH